MTATMRAAARIAGFGTTIFTEMSALAVRHQAINLGQGFPDTDGPPELLAALADASGRGEHQYPPLPGVPALRQAIAAHQRRFYGIEIDPDREVQVTAGATEAITAAVLGLCDPGDEVIVLEPAYDSYGAAATLAGAVTVAVPLDPPTFAVDAARIEAAVTARTKAIIVNTPHNPTGHVWSAEERLAVADVCIRNDLVAISDEVYEHLVYEGEHRPLAAEPGMWERTVTVGSAGKTFNCTGWKIGWVTAPAEVIAAVRAVKQWLTFSSGNPLQHAVAVALGLGDDVYAQMAVDGRRHRDLMAEGLTDLGFEVLPSAEGSYFVVVDPGPLFGRPVDAGALCRWLPEAVGVAAVPLAPFSPISGRGHHLVRFAHCKRDAVLDEALARLAKLDPGAFPS
jgi:N-succinyldiaminopimelate aminotransferase